MKNNFVWSHGPISIELKEIEGVANTLENIETFELENIRYKLAVHTNLHNRVFSKEATITDFPQIIYVEDAINKLKDIDYKSTGCLISSEKITVPPSTGVITSLREVYLNTVILEEEAVGDYSLKIERYDYNFKHSAHEPINTRTTYGLSIGLPHPECPLISEDINIKELSLEEISNFSEVVSSFINKIKNKTAN